VSVLVIVPHIADDFEGHNFNRWWWHSRSAETCRRLCI